MRGSGDEVQCLAQGHSAGMQPLTLKHPQCGSGSAQSWLWIRFSKCTQSWRERRDWLKNSFICIFIVCSSTCFLSFLLQMIGNPSKLDKTFYTFIVYISFSFFVIVVTLPHWQESFILMLILMPGKAFTLAVTSMNVRNLYFEGHLKARADFYFDGHLDARRDFYFGGPNQSGHPRSKENPWARTLYTCLGVGCYPATFAQNRERSSTLWCHVIATNQSHRWNLRHWGICKFATPAGEKRRVVTTYREFAITNEGQISQYRRTHKVPVSDICTVHYVSKCT